MTTVGHSLMGMSLGLLCMPRFAKPSRRWIFLLGFAALGNVPDAYFLHSGPHSYGVRHSLFVNLSVIAAVWLAIVLAAKFARRALPLRIMLFGMAAWLSHLLLDSFYNHGKGVGVCWPLGPGRLNLPIPWFSTLRGGWARDMHTLRVVAIEAAAYGGLLLICLAARCTILKRTTGQFVFGGRK